LIFYKGKQLLFNEYPKLIDLIGIFMYSQNSIKSPSLGKAPV